MAGEFCFESAEHHLQSQKGKVRQLIANIWGTSPDYFKDFRANVHALWECETRTSYEERLDNWYKQPIALVAAVAVTVNTQTFDRSIKPEE